MVALIMSDDVNAWLESTKLALVTLDTDLLNSVQAMVLSQLSELYDTSVWVDSASTPKLVQTIIAMEYAAWTYDKAYADNDEPNTYAATLRQYAAANIDSILRGTISLPGTDTTIAADHSAPAFFPNDVSSATPATEDFPDNGGPAFMMGSVF